MKTPQTKLTFSWKEIKQYISYKTIFARLVHDKSVVPLLELLEGDVLELGAGIHDYSKYARNCATYIRSDYSASVKDDRIQIDATDISFEADKFDAIVCMSALEHIEEFDLALNEIHRVLKPGGKLLLNVPWLFPFHGAPFDFFRFSSHALQNRLNDKFDFIVFEATGNYWISMAMFLQRPIWSRPNNDKANKWYDIVLRLLGVIFIKVGSIKSCAQDDNYALLYNILGKKKRDHVTD